MIRRLFWDIEKVYTWDIAPYYQCWLYKDAFSVRSYSPHKKGNCMTIAYSTDGYRRVKLSGQWRLVHHIVAEHFLGDRPSDLVVNHRDGNKLNNHPNNLEYVTIAENIKHAIAHGLHVCCDPTAMPTYKDGRCKDRVSYKRKWRQERRRKGLKVT